MCGHGCGESADPMSALPCPVADLPIVVDFIHVAQYVWEAAKALIPEDQAEQDHWVRAHLLELLRGKASRVAAGIRRSATLRALAAVERQAVDDCADYLINYAPYLQYDRCWPRASPWPRGSLNAPVVIWSRTG